MESFQNIQNEVLINCENSDIENEVLINCENSDIENSNIENSNIENEISESEPLIPVSGINMIDFPKDQVYFNQTQIKEIRNKIKMGNIDPNGKLEPTPDGMKIELKIHQKRMLYEMIIKENLDYRISSGINAFCIADKVGAGKSYEVLSLITKSPIVNNFGKNKLIYKPHTYSNYTTIKFKNNVQLKTNLIVVPHGIYNQWLNYIVKFTNLTYLGIGFNKDINKMDLDKIKEGEYNVILVKSTRYNDFMKKIYSKIPSIQNIRQYKDDVFCKKTKNNLFNIQKLSDDLYNNIKNSEFDDKFIDTVQLLKEYLLEFDIKSFKKQRNKQGSYSPMRVLTYKGPLFERVFIDEANSIKIPRCLHAYGKYNWFITSSVDDLLVPGGKKNYYSNKILINGIKGSGFIKETFMHNMDTRKYGSIQNMFLKNKDDFIIESFQLPEPLFTKFECYTPPELTALQGVGMPEVIHALNAGDIESAIEYVGCEVKDNKTIVEVVLLSLNNEVKQRITTLENKNSNIENVTIEIDEILNKIQNCKNKINEYSEIGDKHQTSLEQELLNNLNLKKKTLQGKKSSIKISIKNHTEKIKDLKFKAESLTNRISNVETKSCPVCMQLVTNACMTHCCNNIFCFQCLAMSCNYNNTCPLCRSNINMKEIIAISDNKVTDKKKIEKKLPTKLENLINIIKNNPCGKFLVFSEFNNSFNKIQLELEKNNIIYSKLSGSSGRISNIINSFSKNTIKVLLLNAKHYGSGLNLQMTTDIILFHRMSNDLEKQIIGRGQRFGRTSRLNVNYLCYENEI